MIPFQPILDDALERLGGEAALKARLPKVGSAAALKSCPTTVISARCASGSFAPG